VDRVTRYPPNDGATWEETWRIIARMEGLRDLRAVVVEDWLDRDPESEAKLLEPLRAVKGTEVFEVDVSWPANEGERPRNVPFRIKSERKELERERKGSRGCSSQSAVRKTALPLERYRNLRLYI